MSNQTKGAVNFRGAGVGGCGWTAPVSNWLQQAGVQESGRGSVKLYNL